MQPQPPMWRNGRRNGLKIRFREIEVWVRVPPSAPSGKPIYEGRHPARAHFCELRIVQGMQLWQDKISFNILGSVGEPRDFEELEALAARLRISPEAGCFVGVESGFRD